MNTKKTLPLILMMACTVPLIVMALTELRAQRYTGRPVPALKDMLVGGTQALAFTKINAGWKYKKPDVDDSQQMCTIGGTVPTAYTSFTNIPSFTMRSSATHAYGTSTVTFDGVNHTFARDPLAVKGRGTKYSQKFYENSAKTGHPVKPKKYGQFSASIKNGQMKFLYQIPKGNESGMMAETGLYERIQQDRAQPWFRKDVIHEKFEGAAQFMFVAGSEVSYGEQDCKVKIGMSAGKAQLRK